MKGGEAGRRQVTLRWVCISQPWCAPAAPFWHLLGGYRVLELMCVALACRLAPVCWLRACRRLYSRRTQSLAARSHARSLQPGARSLQPAGQNTHTRGAPDGGGSRLAAPTLLPRLRMGRTASPAQLPRVYVHPACVELGFWRHGRITRGQRRRRAARASGPSAAQPARPRWPHGWQPRTWPAHACGARRAGRRAGAGEPGRGPAGEPRTNTRQGGMCRARACLTYKCVGGLAVGTPGAKRGWELVCNKGQRRRRRARARAPTEVWANDSICNHAWW